MGKIAFKWVYWDMLLPGYLPNVPLLPSHMNFIGKDLTKAPQIRRSAEMLIKDVMTSKIVTVREGTSLQEAARLMAQHNVSSVPVINVDNKLIGVLTEADFLSALDIEGNSAIKTLFDVIITRRRPRKTMGTIVDDLMTRNPVTIGEGDTLQRAVNLMSNNSIKRLLVTDEQRQVKGIVSRADLMKLFTSR